MKKNDKKYTIANAAGFIFPVTTVYMATYVIDSFQAKEYDLVVCTLFLVSCSVALTIVTGKSSIQNGYAEEYSRSVIRKSTRSGFWGLWRNIMARWTTILLPTIRKPTPSRRNGGRNEKPKERER